MTFVSKRYLFQRSWRENVVASHLNVPTKSMTPNHGQQGRHDGVGCVLRALLYRVCFNPFFTRNFIGTSLSLTHNCGRRVTRIESQFWRITIEYRLRFCHGLRKQAQNTISLRFWPIFANFFRKRFNLPTVHFSRRKIGGPHQMWQPL